MRQSRSLLRHVLAPEALGKTLTRDLTRDPFRRSAARAYSRQGCAVFNGGHFDLWRNQGGNSPAKASNSPWRQPPTTTLAVGDPAFQAANGAIDVNGST